VLKDYLLMVDSEGAQKMAKRILKRHDELDFDALLKSSQPAKKKSVKKYFKSLLKDTKALMAKTNLTVDEVHDVRKNLRDILRFMQMQNAVNLTDQDTPEIEFLKKTNLKLGEICDDYASQILRQEIDEFTVVSFPEKIRPRVEHFLDHYEIRVAD